jgi:ABC-2 type transport system ATP-binding protein
MVDSSRQKDPESVTRNIKSAESSDSTTAGSAALEVNSLGFDYGKRAALIDITLSIKPAELVILLGPNGAGKTTLFSLICGLFSPARGTVSINGRSLSQRTQALAPLGIVFQSQTLDLDLSVIQNLLYFCALQGIPRKTARPRIDDALKRMDLHARAHEKVRALNGGHRRRVEIIRATLHNPAILLLDEPTVGLDIPTRAELLDYIRDLPGTQGCAVLWATHLIDEIRDTDRVALVHAGKLHHDGIAKQLLASTRHADLPALMQSLMDGTSTHKTASSRNSTERLQP